MAGRDSFLSSIFTIVANNGYAIELAYLPSVCKFLYEDVSAGSFWESIVNDLFCRNVGDIKFKPVDGKSVEEIKREFGKSRLVIYAEKGRMDLVGKMLKISTINLNQTIQNSCYCLASKSTGVLTAIKSAIRAKHFDIAKLLLETFKDLWTLPVIERTQLLRLLAASGNLSLLKFAVEEKNLMDLSVAPVQRFVDSDGLHSMASVVDNAFVSGSLEMVKYITSKEVGLHLHYPELGEENGISHSFIESAVTAAKGTCDGAQCRDLVQWYVDNGGCVNGFYFDNQEQPPLSMSVQLCACSYVAMTKLLLDNGANPNFIPDHWMKSPLMVAAEMSRADAMSMLIAKGADVNYFVNLMDDGESDYDSLLESGITALHICAELGYDEGVDMLLKAGAIVNIVSFAGYTPLMLASKHGRVTVIHLLLKGGAEPHIHRQIDDDFEDYDGDEFDELHFNSLHFAISSGVEAAVKRLLDFDVSLAVHAAVGNYTPLMHAARLGNVTICKLVHADMINPVARMLQTCACHTGNGGGPPSTVNDQIADGGEFEGFTALTFAVTQNKLSVVRFLLEVGAKADAESLRELKAVVKASNKLEGSTLKIYRSVLSVFFAKTLLPLIKSDSLDLFLSSAKVIGLSRVMKVVRINLLAVALDSNSSSFVKYTIKSPSVPINDVLIAATGERPIHRIASAGKVHLLQALLDNKDLDVNVTNIAGNTALFNACKFSHREVVKLLLAHPNIGDSLVKLNQNFETCFSVSKIADIKQMISAALEKVGKAPRDSSSSGSSDSNHPGKEPATEFNFGPVTSVFRPGSSPKAVSCLDNSTLFDPDFEDSGHTKRKRGISQQEIANALRGMDRSANSFQLREFDQHNEALVDIGLSYEDLASNEMLNRVLCLWIVAPLRSYRLDSDDAIIHNCCIHFNDLYNTWITIVDAKTASALGSFKGRFDSLCKDLSCPEMTPSWKVKVVGLLEIAVAEFLSSFMLSHFPMVEGADP